MENSADSELYQETIEVTLASCPVDFCYVESETPSKILSNLQMLGSSAPTMSLVVPTSRFWLKNRKKT